MLANVLRQTAPVWPSSWIRHSWKWSWAPAAALGAAAWIFFVAPSHNDAPEFTARGAKDEVSFTLGCGSEGSCVRGATLLFRFEAPAHDLFFSAFARHQEGAVVWYFPGSGQTESMSLKEISDGDTAKVGIHIGAEHPPGRYEVYGFFSEKPLRKSEIKACVEDGPCDGVTLVRRRLVVRP